MGRGGGARRSSVRLRPAHHTNLDGQVSGAEPPFHPLLRGGRALTWALSAAELPQEEQQVALKNDRQGGVTVRNLVVYPRGCGL